MANYPDILFELTSPSHWRELVVIRLSDWEALVSGTCVATLIWLGDVLLVSAYHHNVQLEVYRS
jgi:hypothetical protein